MGCGMSTEEKEGKARNEEIENQLKKDRMMQRNEIKMLLLGKLSPCGRLSVNSLTTGQCICNARSLQELLCFLTSSRNPIARSRREIESLTAISRPKRGWLAERCSIQNCSIPSIIY